MSDPSNSARSFHNKSSYLGRRPAVLHEGCGFERRILLRGHVSLTDQGRTRPEW